MQSLILGKHRLGDAYRSVVSALTVTNTESRFLESGTLTPEEFVQAGDQLTFKFPTWQWEAGEPSRRAGYLPSEQQYLITRNVPCKDRVRALDYALEHKTRNDDGWVLPETASSRETDNELRDVDDLTGKPAQNAGASAASDEAQPVIVAQENFFDVSSTEQATGDALPDFGDLNAQLAENDPACADDYLVADAPDADVMQTRTYDLSITYDKYYQTPRLWLFGYDENRKPLKPDQVYEDVLSEYVSKTVTVDPHPLSGTPTVSIHPCKHAQVMKKVVDDWITQGITPRHDLALFVFLKFISGVVPTINYDFTMDIEF